MAHIIFIDIALAIVYSLYIAVWRHNVKGRKYLGFFFFSWFGKLIMSIIDEV